MSSEVKSNMQGSTMAIIVVGFLYTTIEKFGSSISLNPLNPDAVFNIAVFVPAVAAIIFGSRVGAFGSGMGGLFIEIQNVLAGQEAAAGLPIDAFFTATANFIGAYTTGLLTDKGERITIRNSMKSILKDLNHWKRIGSDTISAVIGVALTTSFLGSLLDQVEKGRAIEDGSSLFLSNFFTNAVVIVLFVPITLWIYDGMTSYLVNKGLKLSKAAKNMNVEVTDEGGVKLLETTLSERPFTLNVWTPLTVKFKNITGRRTRFYIEGVSTARIYPNKDKTKYLEPDEEWTQTFYILPSKSKEVDIRLRFAPRDKVITFKEEIVDDTVVEINAGLIDPSKSKVGLAQFSGINFSVMGFTFIWQDLVRLANDPSAFLNQLSADWTLLGITALFELVIFSLLLFLLYKLAKRRKTEDKLRLAFSEDIADYDIDDSVKSKGRKILGVFLRYQRYTLVLIKFLIGLAAITSVFYLGYEGYRAYQDPNYQTQFPELVVLAGGITMVSFVVGIKGLTLLQSAGIKKLPSWMLGKSNVIIGFNPLKNFQEDIPNEIIIRARNPTNKKGIRVVFQGYDTINPPMVDLHIEPNEEVDFKIAITPLEQEPRNILVLAYPFFDENENMIDFEEAEPFDKQEIQYDVMAQTSMGLTKDQKDKLLKVAGLGSVITLALSFVNQFITDVDTVIENIESNLPFFAMLQAPFAYVYLYFQNNIMNKAGVKL